MAETLIKFERGTSGLEQVTFTETARRKVDELLPTLDGLIRARLAAAFLHPTVTGAKTIDEALQAINAQSLTIADGLMSDFRSQDLLK